MQECANCGEETNYLIEVYGENGPQDWCESCENDCTVACDRCGEAFIENQGLVQTYREPDDTYLADFQEYLCRPCAEIRANNENAVIATQHFENNIIVKPSEEKTLYFQSNSTSSEELKLYAITLPKKRSQSSIYESDGLRLELPYAGANNIYDISSYLNQRGRGVKERVINTINQAISETEIGEIGDKAIITIRSQGEDIFASIYYETTGRETQVKIKNPKFKNQKPEIRTEIHNYHADKPKPVFLRTAKDRSTNDFVGIELETEYESGEYGDKIRAAIEKGRGIFYAEHDGSLVSGAELISHPMSIPYLSQKSTKKVIEAMLDRIRLDGGMGQTSNRAGMHIHVSTPTRAMARARIRAELIWLYTFFERELEALSRRKQTSYCTYPAELIKKSLKNVPVKSITLDKDGTILQPGRHNAINFDGNGGATIEFRTFASTTHYSDILAAAKISQRIVKFCAKNSVDGATLNQILQLDKDPELMQYTKATFAVAGVSIANINKKVRREMTIRKEDLYQDEDY